MTYYQKVYKHKYIFFIMNYIILHYEYKDLGQYNNKLIFEMVKVILERKKYF